MKWKLECLYDGIYHLRFEDAYDAAMHFLRYQENYESPEWRECNDFSLLEYMEWYAKTQTEGWSKKTYKRPVAPQIFSYPSDWGGFNVPSYVFDRCNVDTIPDWNPYDQFMHSIVSAIRGIGDDEKFYLLGTTEGPESGAYLDHEISHGLFYTNEEYRDASTSLFYNDTPNEVLVKLREWLESGGYHSAVVVDETVAYLATGLPDELKKDAACKKARGKFQRLFKKTIKALD